MREAPQPSVYKLDKNDDASEFFCPKVLPT
jgi:hypothetical protein